MKPNSIFVYNMWHYFFDFSTDNEYYSPLRDIVDNDLSESDVGAVIGLHFDATPFIFALIMQAYADFLILMICH